MKQDPPSSPLQCYLVTSFHSEKIFLRGKGRELFDIGLPGGQQGRYNRASRLTHHVAVRAADFAQQAMHSHQPQLAGDYTLQMNPESGHWKPINVRELVLKPD